MPVEPHRDAYGQMLLAALEDGDVVEIVERDDGFVSAADARRERAACRA